ncbi:MAG: hypothetical protein AB8B99_01850 [Phormidesmis sp.]
MTRLKHREPATDSPPTHLPPTHPAAQLSSSATMAPPVEDVAQPTGFKQPEQSPSERPPSKKPPSNKSKSRDLAGEISSENKIYNQKKGSLRTLGHIILRYPNVAQILLFLTVIGGTSLVLIGLLFQGAWSDRDNNFAILNTILKMELNREDVRTLEDSPERVLTHTFRTLEPHVEADGWTWINRIGKTITYGKQDQRMIASCRPYSPLYMICELGEIPQ